MEKILIVEDEPAMLMGLRDNLEFEGYKVFTARTGKEGLASAAQHSPNLILLDIMLPEIDGLELLKQLRAAGQTTPVIMLTARSRELDKVRGLELGADDYITKPFSVRELLARIKAVLRRTRDKAPKLQTYTFAKIEIDFRRSIAKKKGNIIPLSYFEQEILRCLIGHKEEPVSRNQLLDEVWGLDLFPTTRTIDNHIVKLRQKLEDDPKNPRHILTVHGIGYKFVD